MNKKLRIIASQAFNENQGASHLIDDHLKSANSCTEIDLNTFKMENGKKMDLMMNDHEHEVDKRNQINQNTNENGQSSSNKISESLYSRQLLVIGHSAHERMSNSKVLVLNCCGLGQEICKNMILTGVSVEIFDNKKLKIEDFATGYYFKEKHLGTRKDSAILDELKMLNCYVNVEKADLPDNFYELIEENDKSNKHNDLIEKLFSRYTLVISVNNNLQFDVCLNNFLFKINKPMISTIQRGLNGIVINDFINFKSYDLNGESSKIGIISDIWSQPGEGEDQEIIQENKSENLESINSNDFNTNTSSNSLLNNIYINTIKMIDRHNLENGDIVSISAKNYKIEVVDSFKIKIITNHKIDGDTFEEIKKIGVFKFERIIERLNLKENKIVRNNYVLGEFERKNGRLPRPYNQDDWEEVRNIHCNFLRKCEKECKCDLISLKMLTFHSTTSFQPLISIIGGYVAQEALKQCSEKFTPLMDVFTYECEDLLVMKNQEKEESDQFLFDENITKFDVNHPLLSTRYNSLYILFGDKTYDLLSSKVFLVGAGAIGCEHLKNLVGNITLTDMDSIEESNLNRQFLFRRGDMGKFKSECAGNAILKMRGLNDENAPSITSYTHAVNSQTENVFSDSFIKSFDLIALALDNAEAREYMDNRAIQLKVPMFDSGTLGTKGHTQVVIPYLTESYSSSRDPPEKEIPLCTIRNFPHLIEHCVEWSMGQFNSLFVNECKKDDIIDELLKKHSSKNDNNDENDSKKDENVQLDNNIPNMIEKNPPTTKKECLNYAHKLLVSYFVESIEKLIKLFPHDHRTEEGILFWEPPKKYPRVLEMEENNELIKKFMISGSNLIGKVWIGDIEIDENDFNQYMENFDNDSSTEELEKDSIIENRTKKTIKFEKDDDSNYHIDFIYALTNLRAFNYKIKNTSRLEVKRIAGKIIPAIATTTAVISGMSCIEMYKYILYKKKLNDESAKYKQDNKNEYEMIQIRPKNSILFKNTFINLALPFITESEPFSPQEIECKVFNCKFNLWDEIRIKNCTLNEIIEIFKKENKNIEMISVGDRIVFCGWDNKKYDKFLKMKICGDITEKKQTRMDILFEIECDDCMGIIVSE